MRGSNLDAGSVTGIAVGVIDAVADLALNVVNLVLIAAAVHVLVRHGIVLRSFFLRQHFAAVNILTPQQHFIHSRKG